MTEFSLNSSFASEVTTETYNNAHKMNPLIPNHPGDTIVLVILFILCFLGLLGNGKVIWILGFCTKRNSFSTYVLNLAVADFGVLIMEALMLIFLILGQEMLIVSFIFLLFCFVLYYISQLLLISISVDRCVSVLFPIWQQCHRPPKLSFIVCAIIWILSVLLFALEMTFFFSKVFLLFQLIFNCLISYLVMITSTLILLVKIKQLQLKRKKALKLTLLALMCFIVFRLPLSILSIINYIKFRQSNLSVIIGTMIMKASKEITLLVLLPNICIAVNSSINPIIYFLAGRNKVDQSRVSMKLALQRIFRCEEDAQEDEMQPDEI